MNEIYTYFVSDAIRLLDAHDRSFAQTLATRFTAWTPFVADPPINSG